MNKPFLRSAFISIFFLAASVSQAQVTKPAAAPEQAQFPKANASQKLTYSIINVANNTFGYDILANGKLMIHQPSVPGMPGNEGFKTKPAAEKVAQLVIGKIKKGEMPPTVTLEEMKKLKAIN